jgi:hypothetical protein
MWRRAETSNEKKIHKIYVILLFINYQMILQREQHDMPAKDMYLQDTLACVPVPGGGILDTRVPCGANGCRYHRAPGANCKPANERLTASREAEQNQTQRLFCLTNNVFLSQHFFLKTSKKQIRDNLSLFLKKEEE